MPSTLLLDAIRQLTKSTLKQVDAGITAALASRIPLIQQISQHIVYGKGKRIRPLLVLLTSLSCETPEKDAAQLAVIIELVHTATLLHDDVVDQSLRRRGLLTANALWGDEASVLVGDFVYSRAFQWMTRLHNSNILATLAEATNILAEGEVLQLANRKNPRLTEDHYFQVIYCKTAKLFEAGAQLGGLLHERETKLIQAYKEYGKHIGMAYQITDDLLDYRGTTELLGKEIGADLAQGKVTLPLIYALQHGSASLIRQIQEALTHPHRETLLSLLPGILASGAFDYCQQLAKHHLQQAEFALHLIPEGPYKTGLHQLAHFIATRES